MLAYWVSDDANREVLDPEIVLTVLHLIKDFRNQDGSPFSLPKLYKSYKTLDQTIKETSSVLEFCEIK
jgi:hypothetical protein